ncbi:MAG: DUF4230 domain-containing protein [Hungatella sp.]
MSDKGNGIKKVLTAKAKKTALILAGIFIFLLFLGAFFYGRKLGGAEAASLISEKKRITDDVLKQQLEAIGELSTAKYYYTDMGRYEKNLALKGQTIPFTKTSFLITYDGIIKAGVELKAIKFVLHEKIIRIMIPEAKILSHDIDPDSVQVFDEKNSIFNGLTTEDVTGFQSEQRKIMEERALNNGLLTEAKENTKDALTSIYRILLSDGQYEGGYTLEFQ